LSDYNLIEEKNDNVKSNGNWIRNLKWRRISTTNGNWFRFPIYSPPSPAPVPLPSLSATIQPRPAAGMASPPPFDICDDLDDAAASIPVHPRHNPTAPTPNGLNDRLLRLTRTRPQNPSPNPPAPPPPGMVIVSIHSLHLGKVTDPSSSSPLAEEEEARKVKLAGRRRLCKTSDSTAAAATAQEELEDDLDDGGSIYDILNDLTTRFDSLSVQKTNPARPTSQQVAPLPCALTTDPDDDDGSSPLQASMHISRGAMAKPADPTSVFTAHHSRQEVHNDKGVTKDWGTNRVPGASSFSDSDADDSEDVGWEKTEDFKMEPTGSAASSKPYKLPGTIFKILYPHQREGLQWLWVLHCRGTGGILGDDMGLGKTMQVSPSVSSLS
jgi:DNA excision repair protein ERCC-6-like